MTKQEFRITRDMLDGNVNRIMVTDSIEELNKQYRYAIQNLFEIYKYRYDELNQQ